MKRRRFEETEEYRRAIEALRQLFDKHDRGDIVEWSAIEEATGYRRDGPKLRAMVTKFRKVYLREDRIALRPVPGVGYRILTLEQQVLECGEDRRRKMYRQSTRAVREISAPNNAKLGTHLQHVKALSLQHLLEERKTINRGIRSIRSYAHPKPVTA